MLRATDAHISVISHIGKDELLRYLTDTEAGNGFANRFLWACVRRANILPEGGSIPSYGNLIQRLREALETAQRLGELKRDAAAKAAWAKVYPELSEGKPGLFGAVTARAEAQVLRLSLLYAIEDGSTTIQMPHLTAALAVWEYCEASARYTFGDATGDVVADRIYETLCASPEGLTRTAISNLFTRKVPASRLDQALGLLLRLGKLRPQTGETPGRPMEVWYAMV